MKTFTDKEISQLSSWLEGQRSFVFLDTSRVSEENRCSYLFINPIKWLACENRMQVDAFYDQAIEFCRKGYYLAGWFNYEFGYIHEPRLLKLSESVNGPFAVLGIFESPVVFDHGDDNSLLINELTGDLTVLEQVHSLQNLHANIDNKEYLDAIAKIKEYLVAGDTYQVNYTFKLHFDFNGSAASFYQSLRRNQSVSYGAWIRCNGYDIMSFSPELFFRTDREKVTVRPMKGTMARGKTIFEDMPRQNALREDLKNLSENVMIVDLLRNDVGHLLHREGGGVVQPRSLFDVEAYETVLQMTSTIDGIRYKSQDPDIKEIFNTLFPCGSVTGAPKIRTMEIINELEKDSRGVYCGAIGFFNRGEAVFNVPIRTAVLGEGKGEMGVGSGIVFDSDPKAEWEECILKGKFLTHPRTSFQLIETLLWQPDTGYWLLQEHMDRLVSSAAYFSYHCDQQRIIDLLEKKSRTFNTLTRVRMLLERDGTVSITAAGLEAGLPKNTKAADQESLPLVCFSDKKTDPENVHLYHKTSDRDLYTAEREDALAKGFHEVLFVNMKGEVTEGSITNIFVQKGDRLCTPPVRSGLLAGTFRRYLLEKGEVFEQVLHKDDILAAENVYVGNSVRGLVKVLVIE